jgi:dihydrofolate reductase
VGSLIYAMNVSLDGFVETTTHSLDWSVVDEELHRWFGDEIRASDALLYGRRLWETMAAYWPAAEADPNATDYMLDFARVWNAAPKIVFSTTLESVGPGARLVRPAAGAPSGARVDVVAELERLRGEFPGMLSVGGPNLAAEFIRHGLVDEYRIVSHPVALGAGTPFFPNLDEPMRLRLIDERRFASGVKLLVYRPR